MNAKKRYFSLFILTLVLLTFIYVYKTRRKPLKNNRSKTSLHAPNFIGLEELQELEFVAKDSEFRFERSCRMETCFNFDRCREEFKVYVYPGHDDLTPSNSYKKIIQTIKESNLWTEDPSAACLFVLALDTLDRDPLSQDFIRNMQFRVDQLEHWRNGENHLIFNLYSGTWPHYTEDLGFDIGKAILAKASIAVENYRPNFDISLPLFHKTHPWKGGDPGYVTNTIFPDRHQYFLAFKGKRYVYGIGSETRNSLYHLHNGHDLALVTTCKHGNNWKEMQDDRCEVDNAEYDRWDYTSLLNNSTFCLVPRGRRLGSFRFLETLEAGCVPVILSNGWQLPFGEVIDWPASTVSIDERQLLQVPEILRMIPHPKVFEMRQQTQIVWDLYLSSVKKIVLTTLEIIRQRISPHKAASRHAWNSRPGVFFADSRQPNTDDVCVVINTVSDVTAALTSGSNIFRILKSVGQAECVKEVVVNWESRSTPPPLSDWFRFGAVKESRLSLNIFRTNASSLQQFRAAESCSSDNILSLDDDVTIAAQEIMFAHSVYKDFPDRLIGFSPRSHFWDGEAKAWRYSSKQSTHFSMIGLNAAMYAKKYAAAYSNFLSHKTISYVEEMPHCRDILFNFLVAHITKKAPIKVTQRKRLSTALNPDREARVRELEQKQECFSRLVSDFGEMPLIQSQIRMDPVLFKDPVSNLRKKYRTIETL